MVVKVFLFLLTVVIVNFARADISFDYTQIAEAQSLYEQENIEEYEVLNHIRYRCWARGRYNYTTTAKGRWPSQVQQVALKKCVASGHSPCRALGCRRVN